MPLNSGTTHQLNSVCFVSADTGYIAGDSCTLLKTTDGGVTWVALHPNLPADLDLKSVYFIDANHGWICGEYIMPLFTIDGGLTWDTGTLGGFVPCLYSVFFPTIDTGYAVGDNNPYGAAVKTTMAGFHWDPLALSLSHIFRTVYFLNGHTGFIGGDAGSLTKTTDGGLTWSNNLINSTHDVRSIYFVDPSTGFAAGDSSLLLKTIDGGNTWTAPPNSISGSFTSVHFIDPPHGLIVGKDGMIGATMTNGSSWELLISGVNSNLNAVYYAASDTAYVVGDAGVILKTTNGGGVGIQHLQALKNVLFLSPNPAIDHIRVESSPDLNPQELTILNVNGNIIANNVVKGSSFLLDIIDLPSGIYFIQVKGLGGVAFGKFIKN